MPTLLAPFTKLARAVSERGVKGMLLQLYTIGDLKFGQLKGTDHFGNKYYEDLDQPYGQHRWVEFSDIHNPDPVLIPPDWHGWMHHVFDETPDEMRKLVAQGVNGNKVGQFDIGDAVDSHAAAAFNTHIYEAGADNDKTKEFPHHDLSQYRARGYMVGSLHTTPGEPDRFYKQPGHPLYEAPADAAPGTAANGRFDKMKGWEAWDPAMEAEDKATGGKAAAAKK